MRTAGPRPDDEREEESRMTRTMLKAGLSLLAATSTASRESRKESGCLSG